MHIFISMLNSQAWSCGFTRREQGSSLHSHHIARGLSWLWYSCSRPQVSNFSDSTRKHTIVIHNLGIIDVCIHEEINISRLSPLNILHTTPFSHCCCLAGFSQDCTIWCPTKRLSLPPQNKKTVVHIFWMPVHLWLNSIKAWYEVVYKLAHTSECYLGGKNKSIKTCQFKSESYFSEIFVWICMNAFWDPLAFHSQWMLICLSCSSDAEVQKQFALNQSRVEEITMKEDLGNITLTQDDAFGKFSIGKVDRI